MGQDDIEGEYHRHMSMDRTIVNSGQKFRVLGFNYKDLTTEGDGLLSCDNCGLIFGSKHEINKHLLIHVRPIICPSHECNLGFAFIKDCKRHFESTHKSINDRLDYTCPACKKGYTRKDNLEKHYKAKHPNLGRRPLPATRPSTLGSRRQLKPNFHSGVTRNERQNPILSTGALSGNDGTGFTPPGRTQDLGDGEVSGHNIPSSVLRHPHTILPNLPLNKQFAIGSPTDYLSVSVNVDRVCLPESWTRNLATSNEIKFSHPLPGNKTLNLSILDNG